MIGDVSKIIIINPTSPVSTNASIKKLPLAALNTTIFSLNI
jgi:hypothetical protein